MATPTAPILLTYSAPAPPSRRRPALLLLLCLPALAVPFLDFAWRVAPASTFSPLGSTDWLFRSVAGSFFTPFLLLLFHAWQLARFRPCRRLFTGLAVLAWAPLAAMYGQVAYFAIYNCTEWPTIDQFVSGWPFYLDASLAGLALFFSLRLARPRPDAALSLALTSPFIVNSTLCLIVFHDVRPGPGYWLTLAVLPLFLLDLYFHLRPSRSLEG